jgi:hypothetical protein
MAQTYKRKTNPQSWVEGNMLRVLETVISKRMGYKKAAQSFNMSHSTLEGRAGTAKQGMTLVHASRKRQ